MSHVLIVDDEPSICWGFRELLTDEGHQVSVAPSAEEALARIEEEAPDAVMLDVRLPGMDGLTAIKHLRDRLGHVPIIVMTAFGSLDIAVRAVEAGAFDYLPKPFELEDAIQVLLRATEGADAASATQPELPTEDNEDLLIGKSPVMQNIFKQIALVAPRDTPVLITGESGTGKDLVATAIHRHSRRANGPFLPVCVPALSSNVIESELFGHVRGAFTGAETDRKGLLEIADAGTVFLDEIGDIHLPLQVKLLRAIERHEVTPVGDASPHAANFRIVAATNRPLQKMVSSGEFREDLFYRLSVFHIEIPPLRQRTTDIPLLAESFLRKFSNGLPNLRLSEEAMRELCARPWHGNVRELRNALEHASIVARSETIAPEHLPPPATPTHSETMSTDDRLRGLMADWLTDQMESDADEGDLYERFLNLVEPPLLAEVIARCSQNRSHAARWLGMHRTTLRQKLSQHRIEAP